MKINTCIIYAIVFLGIWLTACEKDESKPGQLAADAVMFDLPGTQDFVATDLDIKEPSLLSLEMKAALREGTASDLHYVTFDPDTTKIDLYKEKYDPDAILLPALNYLFYKSTVPLHVGNSFSDPAIVNIGFQNLLRPHSTYVLPVAITALDGIVQDPGTRQVAYYVFKTGQPLYVDHTGFAVTATASSTAGANTAARAIDANTGTTYWASATSESLPQSLNIDYAREVGFSGIDIFYPTSSNINYNTTGGDPRVVKIETSTDNTVWVDHGTFPVDIRNTARKYTINLPSPTTARYLRATILEAAPFQSGNLTFSVVLVSGIMLRN
ncbi:discoidin domain-containing protein [Sphingobacterium griseoflavum]|uniref:F5/8 type C domain-containing protein n=1 Tax=Sphingobacterium griseoflavum TaxID=1474952 RepID=A0ABQ3I2S2_9SPHI|nr:discoidin domain-containing protein [Sphingobacterium griseoflavum]GHE44699.1 hypothetical protein GCM10017764_29900 [Sphingobacterium griseoflavum]